MSAKVLIVAASQGSYGGIEAFVLTLAKSLAKGDRFEVRVVFKRVKGFAWSDAFKDLAQETDEFAIEFCERGSSTLLKHIRWADLVHCQNASPDVCFWSKLLRKPLVLTIHNWFRSEGWRPKVWSRCSRLADRRWYNSRFVRNTWEPSIAEGEHSRVIPTVSEIECDLAPFEGRRGFVFLSRWIENKGADILIEAYRQLAPDPALWPLVMMGTGPLLESLRDKVQREGIRGIEILGFVPDEEKISRIRQAKWMVTPPHTREDMGLTPIEARSQGIPCIVSDDGGLTEVAGADALVCEPGNVASLKAALAEAIALSDEDYQQRAENTFESLSDLMVPLSFYEGEYSSLLDI